MIVERRPEIVEIIETNKEHYPDTKVITEGETSLLDSRYWLGGVVSELLSNCSKKEGVTTVKIRVEHGLLIVEDDVIHKNPEEILSNVNSENPISTRQNPSGSGILRARTLLAERDGKLKYHATLEGRIIAVGTWIE